MADADTHVVPEVGSDDRQHALARDCWCEPLTWLDPDSEAMVVEHSAWDYPPGSLGHMIRRLRREAELLGAGHIVDQIDALKRTVSEHRDEALRHYFEIED